MSAPAQPQLIESIDAEAQRLGFRPETLANLRRAFTQRGRPELAEEFIAGMCQSRRRRRAERGEG